MQLRYALNENCFELNLPNHSVWVGFRVTLFRAMVPPSITLFIVGKRRSQTPKCHINTVPIIMYSQSSSLISFFFFINVIITFVTMLFVSVLFTRL